MDRIKIKRKLFLLVLSVAVLTGFGALLHSPPSIVDVITGATPKAKKEAQADARLDGSYIFCMNPDMESLKDAEFRRELKSLTHSGSDISSAADGAEFTLYVTETDYALIRYAKSLCAHFKKYGINVALNECSNTMLRSRAVSGKYEAFLASEELLNVTALEQADYITLYSEEMR